MKETTGNIWKYHERGCWIVITTNGDVKQDGSNVMGRGIALQAKKQYPLLPFTLGTVTTKDRYGLCISQLGAVLDIRFRMLQPNELAAAMSFPSSYIFMGNREQRVKQIGNAVPVNLAKELCKAVLG